MSFQTVRTEIPRHPRWGGPLIIPAQHRAKPGTRVCNRCARTWQGKCPCVYYKRCTTFIDVLQSEFALKKYDRRMVAYGMSQRPDLVLAASALHADSDMAQTDTEKNDLQRIADAAKEAAKGDAAATIGTALHKLTEKMDRGETLGRVPDPYPDDLRAYEEATKDIEWVGIESFRVNDDFKVAGTTDRIGWYRGRLRIFDLKTSPKDNAIMYPHGPAMQLAMYARSTPYDIATDLRTIDPGEIDLSVAHIISLPAGSGECRIKPIDILRGWGACQLATRVWKWREADGLVLEDDDRMSTAGPTYYDMAARAGSVAECKLLWANAKEQCALTPKLKGLLRARAEELKTQGVTA